VLTTLVKTFPSKETMPILKSSDVLSIPKQYMVIIGVKRRYISIHVSLEPHFYVAVYTD